MTTSGHDESLPAVQTERSSSSVGTSEVARALANLSVYKSKEDFRDELHKYVTEPFSVKTPPEKVKKRPDGYDYVESSYMDYQFKSHSPLYNYTLLHLSFQEGWVNAVVSLTDRITGNTEIGADAARIQVRQGTNNPGFRDIIDMGNNLKSAITKACKNAQSKFGHSADIYGRRESVPTDEERARYEDMVASITSISPQRAAMFKEAWANLGTDWSEFMDKWQVYVDRNKK